jgi:hypothetical protein
LEAKPSEIGMTLYTSQTSSERTRRHTLASKLVKICPELAEIYRLTPTSITTAERGQPMAGQGRRRAERPSWGIQRGSRWRGDRHTSEEDEVDRK